jgi:triacylglycerol esterase/lipase EstA (alpha/beta hydrolase family)
MRRVAASAFAAAVVALVAMALAPANASAVEYAPPDRPGPPFSVAPAQLHRALDCDGDLGGAERRPVLLIPGTTLTPEAEYSWNWEPALERLAFPYCTVELPGAAMGDIQRAAEYVVFAIRKMSRSSGRRVDLVGHSQGGMIGRWALRFWPDTRAEVGDLVGLAPSNHGTLDAIGACTVPCAAAFWQQRSDARFIAALNSYRETFRGIDYTVAYTKLDEVVVPNLDSSGSSSLHTGAGRIANVALQDVCPTDSAEHLAIGTYDDVAYQLAIDAITHPGPADPARVPASACTTPLMPGVDPSTFATDYASMGAFIARTVATAPRRSSEPPLACYVTASCPGA